MKRKLYLFLISAALFATGTVFAADITSGLILHYTFDNVAGGVVPDASGHSNDGVFMGGAATTTGYGASGNAVSMINQADYVQLPNDFTTSLTDYTVACWVNLNTINYWGRIFDFGNGQATNMFMAPQDGKPYYAIKATDEGGEQGFKSNTAIVAATWTHVALTFHMDEQTGKGTMIMYINGAPTATKTDVTITPASMGSTLQNYIGKSQYNDPTINGSIDDFRVYSRALSLTDIMTLKGVPASLITAFSNLKIDGDLQNVVADLTLPTTMADGVSVSWASTDSSLADPTGKIVRPAKFKGAADLTATLSVTIDGVKSTLTKVFSIIVTPLSDPTETVAIWKFASGKVAKAADGTTTVTDESDNAYVGTCKDGAQIVTIGNTTQFNVLSLKSSGQYFDLGTPIGEAIYGLTDYTVSIFFRKDTVGTNQQYWTGYGQWLYGFSNSNALASTATGAMYYEPLRGRHVNTPDNYGAEGSNFVGAGNNKTPIGTWHNVTYTQTGTTGVLYYDGVQAATGTMTTPAANLKKSGKTGTLYNTIGKPQYAGDPFVTNTLFYGFSLYSVGLTVDDLESVLGINSTITALNEAYGATTYPIFIYADLATLIDKANTAKKTNFVPGLTDLNTAITKAKADYDAKTPTQAGNDSLTAAITRYTNAQAPWLEIKTVLDGMAKYTTLNYPGLPTLNTAVATATDAYNNYNVTSATVATLNAAIVEYLKTQPASLSKPMDYTFSVINPSFENGEGGTLDPTSFRDGNANGNGSYKYPKGWTLYLNHAGWCNAVFVADAPSDGTKCFETWAATINEFKISQKVALKAGYYVVSGQMRTNAAAPYTQHVFAKTPSKLYNSSSLYAAGVITGNGWNGLGNWQTLSTVFKVDAEGDSVELGFNANGFMQFDNLKLTYFGTDQPVQTSYTGYITNAGFEQGTTAGVDASSVKAKNGSGAYNTPIGWNAYCKLDTVAGADWCNMVSISGSSMSEGSKGFEMWSNKINTFKLSQKIAVPASGFYRLTADARCDGSSPSLTDTIVKYDARVYTTHAKFGTKYSAKLGEDKTLITGAGWNAKEAWRKLSVDFMANVGDSVTVGITSGSFMQIDNFTLTYLLTENPLDGVNGPVSNTIGIDVYPNPTADVLHINGLDAAANVKVFNIAGQKVYEGQFNTNQANVDCSKLSQGLYLLQVKSNGKAVTTKFIKK